VESLLVLDSIATGLEVSGAGSKVRSNRIAATGRPQHSTAEDARGILASGPEVRIAGNDVSDTRGQAIRVAASPDAEIRGNRIGNLDPWPSDGIVVIESAGVAVVDNRITRTERGIVFDEHSSGPVSGNVLSGVAVPYEGTEDSEVIADDPR
jgi:nitrous oxidase accessory protein NosD